MPRQDNLAVERPVLTGQRFAHGRPGIATAFLHDVKFSAESLGLEWSIGVIRDILKKCPTPSRPRRALLLAGHQRASR
jgi:hypothetical protein